MVKSGRKVNMVRRTQFDVVVVDPNYPVNDGWYKLPLAVTAGMQIGMDGKYVVVGETMVIRNRRHFLRLWEMWGAEEKK
jgi:hypothetical protein